MSISTSLLWRGLLAIVIGVLSVAWPDATVGAVVILFAVYAFIISATYLMRGFASDGAGAVFGFLLLAVLSAAAGVVAIAWPGITALALTLLIGAWALTVGIIEVSIAFWQGETAGERAMWALTGLVSVALGVVLFIRPDIGALSLATVFGLFSVVYGICALILSAQVNRVGGTVREMAQSAS
jgi:uncharacterized membrane protein HdeD (DUF308 family)